jgi:hypothetical protein
VDLRPHLRRVRECGVAVVPGVLPPPLLASLVADLAGLTFLVPPDDALPATTGSDLCVLRGRDDVPASLGLLRDELTDSVQRCGDGPDALREWRPNEIFVRRYHPGSSGMAPHQDGVRFRYLVATCTVLGSATFCWHDAAGNVLGQWLIRPGDLVLLRGPGWGEARNGRPHHAVDGPAGDLRCSVAFRMRSDATLVIR